MKDKVCKKCELKIFDKENYIKIEEWVGGKVTKKNYMHKNCWMLMMSSKEKVSEAFGMLKGLRKTMMDQGLLPPEVINI